MLVESAFLKPVVDAIPGVINGAKRRRLKRNAEQEITHAIRALLLANPDANRVRARLAGTRAAGHISRERLNAGVRPSTSARHGHLASRGTEDQPCPSSLEP